MIRLVSIITNKSQAELPTRRTGVGLPAWRGLGWPLPSALGIAGDVQGLLRFLGPPGGREHPGLTRAQSFLPNFVESCRGATTPLPLLCACSAATTPANGRLRRPRPGSSEPLAPRGPRSPPAGGASARRSSAQPASCVCPSGFPFSHKDRGGPLPQADLRHLPPCCYLLLFLKRGGKRSNSSAFQREAPEGGRRRPRSLRVAAAPGLKRQAGCHSAGQPGLCQRKPGLTVKIALGEERGRLVEPWARPAVCVPRAWVFTATTTGCPLGKGQGAEAG